MAFWNRKSKKRRDIEVKTLGVNDPISKFIRFGWNGGATTPKYALDLYRDSTVVSIPITRIAETFASLEPVLEIGPNKIEDHPLLDLLRNPCPEFSKELFFTSLATYYLVTGEAFVLAFGNIKQPPKQLYPISPADVMEQIAGGVIHQFDITGNLYPASFTNIGNGIYISKEQLKQLIQIRSFNPDNSSMLRGRSKLVAASSAVRQQLLGMSHNLSLLERGGRLSLVFHFENELDDEEYQDIKQSVLSQYAGADNAGAIGVTAGGKLDIKEAGMTNMDMDWLNAQKLSMNTLLLTYNCPLPLFSTDAATYNNYTTAIEAFYDDAVSPVAGVIYGNLARVLFPKFNIDPKAKLTYDKDCITALKERRTREVKARKDIGIETDNELRAMLGREPYVGGDTMYKPSSEIPIGSDILTTDDDITEIEDDATE